ncbi:MAG: hypothetical protein ACRCSN_16440, partial [Dermatophilaceae bacterium]
MTQLELLGTRERLPHLVASLQRFGWAEVLPDGAPATPTPVDEQLSRLEAVLDGGHLRSLVPNRTAGTPGQVVTEPTPPVDVAAAEQRIGELRATVERLESERESLEHYVDVLSRLEGLVPELASMTDAELETIGLAMVAVVLDDPSGQVSELLREQLTAELGDHFLLEQTLVGASRCCLVVVRREDLAEVENLMGSDRIA